MREEIFTTPLWVFENLLSEEEIGALEELAITDEANGCSVVKSNNQFAHHSANNFAGAFPDLPGAKSIAIKFKECLEDYAYRGLKTVSIQYWSIVSRKYAYNAKHNHGDSLLSSALYICVPDHSGDIKFHDPRPGKLMSNTTGQDSKDRQHQACLIKPKQGMLVVFPSFLEHEVTMTLSTEPRIIYSFNVSPG